MRNQARIWGLALPVLLMFFGGTSVYWWNLGVSREARRPVAVDYGADDYQRYADPNGEGGKGRATFLDYQTKIIPEGKEVSFTPDLAGLLWNNQTVNNYEASGASAPSVGTIELHLRGYEVGWKPKAGQAPSDSLLTLESEAHAFDGSSMPQVSGLEPLESPGLFPRGRFVFEVFANEDWTALDFAVFDAESKEKISDRLTLHSKEDGRWVVCEVDLLTWRPIPVELFLDLGRGERVGVDLGSEPHEVNGYPGGGLSFLGINPDGGNWFLESDRWDHKRTHRLLVQDGIEDQFTLAFLNLDSVGRRRYSVEARDSQGRLFPLVGDAPGRFFDVFRFQGAADSVAEIRLSYPSIHSRVKFSLPRLAGWPEVNRDLADWLDCEIGFALLRREEDLHRLLEACSQLEIHHWGRSTWRQGEAVLLQQQRLKDVINTHYLTRFPAHFGLEVNWDDKSMRAVDMRFLSRFNRKFDELKNTWR